MMKVFILSFFIIGATAFQCPSSLSNDPLFQVSLPFVSGSDSSSQFGLMISNGNSASPSNQINAQMATNILGAYYYSHGDRIVSGILSFPDILENAFWLNSSLSVPNQLVNDGACIGFLITYRKSGRLEAWEGSFVLNNSPSNLYSSRSVAGALAARSDPGYLVALTSSFSAYLSDGSGGTVNSWTVQANTYNLTNVHFTCTEVSGPDGAQLTILYPGLASQGTVNPLGMPAPDASVRKNAIQSGALSISANFDGLYNISCSTTYTVAGTTSPIYTNTVYIPCTVSDSDKRQSIVTKSAVSTIRADYAIALASAGIAVAAVAVVAAVVVVRRQRLSASTF